MELNTGYLRTPSGILKIIEIVYVFLAFAIFRGGQIFNSFGGPDANYFACGVMVTALIITPLLLVCYMMGKTEIQKTILEMALNLLLFIFLMSAGAVAINTWRGLHFNDKIMRKAKRQSIAMGSFCLLSSIAYLSDFIFALKNYRE